MMFEPVAAFIGLPVVFLSFFCYNKNMSQKDKIKLITQNTEEVITSEDLKWMIENNIPLKHYIGFEISGKVHLGSGLVCMQEVKNLMDAGVECTIYLADWHSWINEKLDGKLETASRIARRYFENAIKKALECLGGNPDKLNFILGSDFYHNNDKFWETVIDVSKNTTLARMKRSITILGKKEGDGVDFAKLIYPAMQVADIFAMNVNIAHAGMDQRKAHVIMRDVANQITNTPFKFGDKVYKPVAVHTPLLMGLAKPPKWPLDDSVDKTEFLESLKMSKSKPDSAVFIHDSEDEIRRKVSKAFCMEGEVKYNPILNWAKLLIFTREKSIAIFRKQEHGGDLIFNSYEDLEKSFSEKQLHPIDLKNFISEYLIKLLKPAREFFSSEGAEMLREIENV